MEPLLRSSQRRREIPSASIRKVVLSAERTQMHRREPLYVCSGSDTYKMSHCKFVENLKSWSYMHCCLDLQFFVHRPCIIQSTL